MGKIKAVLFDFDGTLMNTNQIILESWRHTYKAAGVPVPSDEYISWSFGEPLRGTMAKEFPDRDTDEMVEIYRDYQRYIFRDRIEMFPGTAELVKGLKEKGYIVGIVTSRLWQSTVQGLYKFDIAELFDVVISAEDCTAHKPDPQCLLMALDRLKLSADETLYVGDSRFDVLCAKNAGVPSVLVEWTICLPPEKRTGELIPDYTIKAAEDLYALL